MADIDGGRGGETSPNEGEDQSPGDISGEDIQPDTPEECADIGQETEPIKPSDNSSDGTQTEKIIGTVIVVCILAGPLRFSSLNKNPNNQKSSHVGFCLSVEADFLFYKKVMLVFSICFIFPRFVRSEIISFSRQCSYILPSVAQPGHLLPDRSYRHL